MHRSYMQLFEELEERVVILKQKVRQVMMPLAEKNECLSEISLIQQYMNSLRHKLLGEPTGKYPRLETQEGDDDAE